MLAAVTAMLEGQRRAPLVQLDNAIESLVHDVSPSIVQVLVTGIGPVPAPGRTLAVAHEQVIGSGVIVDSAGFIITNAHVVAGAQRVEVIVTPSRTAVGGRLPPRGGPRLAARIVGLDRVTDLAVLKVDTTDWRPSRSAIRTGSATANSCSPSEARRDSRTRSRWAS